MKSFDDLVKLLDSNEVFIDDKNSDMFKLSTLLKDVFKAGAQSKQAEVDEYKEVAESMEDAYLRENAKVDELQKRNEQAIAYIEHWYGCVELSNIVNILNGDMKWESNQ